MADRFDEVKGQTGIHNIYKVAYRPRYPPELSGMETGMGMVITPLRVKRY